MALTKRASYTRAKRLLRLGYGIGQSVRHYNQDEYLKGFDAGRRDASENKHYGARCKETYSHASGYRLGWRRARPSARWRNYEKYGAE